MNISNRTLWMVFGGLLATIIGSSLVVGMWGRSTMAGYGMNGYGMMAYAGAVPMSGWQMVILMTFAVVRIVAIGIVVFMAALLLMRRIDQSSNQ